jgi:hypothetical protein
VWWNCFLFFVLNRNPIWPPLQDKDYLLVLIYKCKEIVLFCFVFFAKNYVFWHQLNSNWTWIIIEWFVIKMRFLFRVDQKSKMEITVGY